MESPPTKFTFIHEAAPGVSLSDRARASVEESGIPSSSLDESIPIDKPCERLDNSLQSGLADRLVDVDGGDVHTALVDVASALAHGGGVGQPFGERE